MYVTLVTIKNQKHTKAPSTGRDKREIKTAPLYICHTSQMNFYHNETKICFLLKKKSSIIIKNVKHLRSYLTVNELRPDQSD